MSKQSPQSEVIARLIEAQRVLNTIIDDCARGDRIDALGGLRIATARVAEAERLIRSTMPSELTSA